MENIGIFFLWCMKAKLLLCKLATIFSFPEVNIHLLLPKSNVVSYIGINERD